MLPFFFSLLTSLSLLPYSTPLPHHYAPFLNASLKRVEPHAPPQQPPKPIKFFEVTQPIVHAPTTPCTHLILTHDFAFTYGRGPVQVPYTPPDHCRSTHFSTVILEWSATCQGRQFDRIFGVWLGGVELLRSCTAEPTRDGIFWKVQKDISGYYSLLMTGNETLQIYLGNVVDKTYTGIYHVNVTIYYYPAVISDHRHGNIVTNNGDDKGNNQVSSVLYPKWADLILPVSRNMPVNDGLWFEIENSTDVGYKEVIFPRNVYRAVLEVFVSYHENDEFWYSNLPNEYIMAHNLTGSTAGNGPFREVLVSLDGELAGAVWPFTVIYTGGINPLLWRPISAIGSFDLPTYDIEITPYLGKLLDGKTHKIRFSVVNSLNVWYIDANLHLWLDKKMAVTKAEFMEKVHEPLYLQSRSDFKGLDGKFYTGASRSIASSGWVASSLGNITTILVQNFEFENHMVLGNDGGLQSVNQTIEFNTTVSAKFESSADFYMSQSRKRFPLFMYTNEADQSNSSYTYQSNVTLGFNEDKILATRLGLSSSSLRNFQKAEGYMVVKNNLVVGGLGSTHQIYEFDDKAGGFCYFRNVSSYNYTILYDEVSERCKSETQSYVSAGLSDHGILL